MTLEQLSERLSGCHFRLLLREDKRGQHISSLAFLPGEGTAFERSALLIGPLSELCKLPSREGFSGAVCMEDNACVLPEDVDLLLLAPETDLPRAISDIETILQEANRRARDWESLLYVATAHKDISELISIAGQLFGNPVVLADKSTKLIARSDCDVTDSVLWDDHTQYGYFTSETMGLLNYKRIHNSLSRGIVHLQKQISKYNTLNKSIVVNDVMIGLVSVLDVNRPFEEEDTELLERLTKILAYYFSMDDSYKFVQDARRESFFLSLLKEPITDRDALNKRANSLGVSGELVYCVASATSQMWDGKTNLTRICEDLAKLFPFCYTLIYNGCILAVIPQKKQQDIPWHSSPALQKYLQTHGITLGVSRSLYGLSNIHEQYWQASMAQHAGRRLKNGKALFLFEHLALHSLFLSVGPEVELQRYCAGSLVRLRQYDAENNASYVETLRSYIQCGGNVTKTAEQLYIHRSTLIYRLKKIEELMGNRLDNHRFRNHIYLSFLISELKMP